MASLIPGYNYDIFISYRQKDNKHDGWVTEFVNQLKGELEATFKEDISIYFDENPHDGLLETHDVDKSLEDKLKCLIFIPIISQTYCDSKSFAWQHEFCAFNKIAKEDQFGRDIKLTSGNVASRILPVKIHDLDPEDKTLIENELGGVLRSIEFIYKEAGVNRPLKPNDDAKENLNKTHYINQVNKVANAVKEIVTALKKQNQHSEEASKEDFKVKPTNQKSIRTKIIIGSLILLVLVVLCYFFIPRIFKPAEELEKSIAVLPFKLLSDEPDKQYQADGMMDAILLHLQKFKDLRVMSRTSVEQYRGTTKTTHQIGKELDVEYLLEGSFQKFGDNVKLIVQLINAKPESHVWANEYNNKWSEIFSVQSEVAQTIAKELHSIITPEEKQLVERIPTTNLKAYDKYLIANEYRMDYNKTRDLNTYKKAAASYKAALELDSAFARAYVGLGWTYFDRYYWPNYYKEDFLDTCLVLANKALSFDNQLDQAYYLKGRYYQENAHIEEALDNFDKTLKINPNNYYAYYAKGDIFCHIKFDMVKAIDNFHKALKLISGDERPGVLRSLGSIYAAVGFIEKANQYFQEALAQDGNKVYYSQSLIMLEFSIENLEEAFRLAEEANKIDSTYLGDMILYNVGSGHDQEAYIHAKKLIEYYKKSGVLNLRQSYRVGYAFWKVGKFKEAEYYLNQQIKYSEESIKLNKSEAQWGQAHIVLAITYAFKGEKVKAYHSLDELNKMNYFPSYRITLLKYDPMLASIRNEERFQTLLKSMEAKNLAEHERVRKWLEEQGML
jgi:TolB-like protein/Tfp pilus assembly protein PilF